MAVKKGRGLMTAWVDVPPEKEEEFNHWYKEEHLFDVLAIPGVLSAARYEAVRGGPKHLACYEIEGQEVWENDAFRQLRRNPTPWAERCSPLVIGTNYVSNVWEMIYPAEVGRDLAESDMAPALQIGRIDIPPELEADFNEWYNTIFLPGFENVPGCIRGRRFTATNPAERYRSITDNSPSSMDRIPPHEPRYLTVYEFEHERVSDSLEWAAQRVASPVTARIRPHMRMDPGTPGIWKKTFQP